MSKYLYAVQDANGREALAAEIETDRVSEVTARIKDGKLELLKGKDVVVDIEAAPETEYNLHRWPADDKLSEPVSKVVK